MAPRSSVHRRQALTLDELADDALCFSVTARTDDDTSTFIIEAGTPGLGIEPAYDKLGWHASDAHGLLLEGCRVPNSHLLGAPGRGLSNFLSILNDGRVAIAALALGCARACLELAVDYAKHRNAFGGPIGRNQAIAFALADLDVAVEAATSLTYQGAHLKDRGRPFSREAAIAALRPNPWVISRSGSAG